MAKTKSDGQAVLEAWVAWISSWIVFSDAPQGGAVLMALWAMHTWFSPRWPSTSYVHVTSDGPGCGKTTLMEVLGSLSLNPKLRATMRSLSVVRDIESTGSACSYFFDQVEALNSPKITEELAILLSGYKASGRHGISVGTQQVEFSTYCAKMFASIGAIHSDLRSRSIVVKLTYGGPKRIWSDDVMVRDGEAARLLEHAGNWFSSKGYDLRRGVIANAPAWVPPSGFVGRDREIMTPLWSVASVLDLDAETLTAISAAMHDHIEFKIEVPQRSYRDLRTERGGDAVERERSDAMQALRDLASVMPTRTLTESGDLSTESALERMKALPHGGKWRMYRGKGLDALTLAALLKRFEVEDGRSLVGPEGPKAIRETRKRGPQRRGYAGKDVRMALARATAGVGTL